MKKLILMRGLPGSGKSFLGKQLAKQAADTKIYSTDDLFMVNGEYRFNPAKLGKFHKENQLRVEHAMGKGISLIIVDNTNTQLWEMRPYIKMAKKFGYLIECVIPETAWAFDAEECAKKNTHGVPLDAIKRMLARFERDIDLTKEV